MNTLINKLSTKLLNLEQFQIEMLNHQVNDFIHANNEANTYNHQYCPKCGKANPRLIKGGTTRAGKQMLRCLDCKRRFVIDHGRYSFYSHKSQAQWNEVIKHTFLTTSLKETAALTNIHESTIFHMRHKILNALEIAECP